MDNDATDHSATSSSLDKAASLDRNIQAIRKLVATYRGKERTRDKDKLFRLLVRHYCRNQRRARFLLEVAAFSKKNEEARRFCLVRGFIDKDTLMFLLEPENYKNLRRQVKELSKLRTEAREMVKSNKG